LAYDFLKELDDDLSGGKIASVTASTGGVKVIWNKKFKSTAGRARWRREKTTEVATGQHPKDTGGPSVTYRHVASIELSEEVVIDEDRLFNVMAHEYCHLATCMINGVGDDHHGKLFQEWGNKCTQAFRHRGVVVTTKHSYAIDHKYIWDCTSCGTKVKRHSKSVDPKRHNCRRCKSTLVQTKPDPERAPSPNTQTAISVEKRVETSSDGNLGSIIEILHRLDLGGA
ncbi:SprT-like family-domain-containing protein, partial [Leptodontidium sp. 2 PMI_412]